MTTDVEEERSGVLEQFQAVGAGFMLPLGELVQKVARCRALVFDWDGVFNTGEKGPAGGGGFHEPDAMGTNMLRYGMWRKTGELPFTAVISGENNESAIAFANREHLTRAFTGVRDKRSLIESLCQEEGLVPEQIACVFDDINDLAMAQLCGLRLMVRRQASPMLADYVRRNSLCDYLSGADARAHGVREICEMLLGLMGMFDEVLDSRVALDHEYHTYWEERQAITTAVFKQQGECIIAQQP